MLADLRDCVQLREVTCSKRAACGLVGWGRAGIPISVAQTPQIRSATQPVYVQPGLQKHAAITVRNLDALLPGQGAWDNPNHRMMSEVLLRANSDDVDGCPVDIRKAGHDEIVFRTVSSPCVNRALHCILP